MPIKTIFFDLGGVLINFSHEKMCHNIADFCGLDLDIVKNLLYEQKMGEKYEKGEVDSLTIHRYFSELAEKPLNYTGLMEAAAQIFSPKQEMVPILETLKKKGMKLFLLSNTCEAHFLHAKKIFEFLTLFEDYILSYEVNARKPEEKIYKIALEKGNTPIEDCFYTDDVSEYVDAAEKLGLDSHLFKGAPGLLNALEKRGFKS